MNNAVVFNREKNERQTLKITSDSKPTITKEMKEKWQRILNLIAKILSVPASLIMEINEESLVVFLKSEGDGNSYEIGGSDQLGHGLYCETVLGDNKPLLIENALKNEKWENNPDVKLNMISYYGLPIHWHDQEFFGTICVLDDKSNSYSEDFKDLMKEFKSVIELDLKMLSNKDQLAHIAEMDMMTSSYNRYKIEEVLENEFNRSLRSQDIFSMVIMDLNNLKEVNDNFGHDMGDRIIKVFANGIKERIRAIDSLGRWGGDEFVLVCPNTGYTGIKTLMVKISKSLNKELNEIIPKASFCYGCAAYTLSDFDYKSIFKRADLELYECKKCYKKK